MDDAVTDADERDADILNMLNSYVLAVSQSDSRPGTSRPRSSFHWNRQPSTVSVW